MIITSASVHQSHDLPKTCWNGIRRFHNVQFVTDLICKLHRLPNSQKQNARKQAEQLKYCLIQAKEYYDAAQAVSLATKPVLMYYSMMSLALAEILLKQDGDSSLDRARSKHAHHGLSFRIETKKEHHKCSLDSAAASLRAAPLIISDQRFGTFELWHRSSREMPLIGRRNRLSKLGTTTYTYEMLMIPRDEPPSDVKAEGVTLLECLQQLPTMYEYMRTHGVKSLIVRANVVSTVDASNESSIIEHKVVTVHPYDEDVLEMFYSNIIVRPSDVDRMHVTELESGIILRFSVSQEYPLIMSFPPSASLEKDEVRFFATNHPLNEFGLFYVALHIAGNYARYFPDKWLVDIDSASPLALAVEELIAQAEQRISVLSLSELTRSYIVPD